MDNGVKLRGFLTATNRVDSDIFGNPANLYCGVEVTVPLGGIKALPDDSHARVLAAPMGRDSGQALDAPLPLYDATEPLSMRHIARHWNDVVQ